MALSNDLISQFVKATQDKNETKQESTAYGKIVKQGDVEYVQLDGSDLLTPIETTTVVKDGDRVIVTIKNHTAIVTGDLTTPSANTEDVKEIGNKITEFEIVIADKVSTQQLEAEIAKIDKLIADEIEATNIKVETMEAKVAEIDTIKADVVVVSGKVTAHEAEFKTLRADIADFKDVTAESVEVIEGEFHTLESDYADFKVTTTNKLTANEASITDLDAKKLDAESAKIIYANIDFSNIGQAAVEKLFSESGIIKDLIMSDGKVTGELVGVTIKGDLIEGNTLKADKLVILGEDGIYYKLNVNALGETTASSDEKYQNGLDGSVIIAKSITADRIAVTDLVAFGATIGGYHIDTHALYSGVKNSATNTTRGVFLGDDGQMAVGDSNNYLKFFIDENGQYKLEIQASSLKFGAGGSTIEDVVKDSIKESIDDELGNLTIGGTNILRGTNSVTTLTETGTWQDGTWRSASSGTGTRTSIEVTDSPNANIKVGWNITSTEGQVMISQDFVPTSNKQEYTISCYARGTGKVALQYGNPDVGYLYDDFVLDSDTEWSKYSYTFESPGEGNVYIGVPGDCDVDICGIKLEIGNISTDWTPAPEDAETDIADAKNTADNAQTTADNANSIAEQNQISISEAYSMIQQLANSLGFIVEEQDDKTVLTQTKDGWSFTMQQNITDLNTSNAALNKTQSEIATNLESINKNMDEVKGKTAYVTISQNPEENPYIELGKEGNKFKVRITNTAIDFLEDSAKLAYANNKAFYAEKMIVKNELQIGTGPGFVWKTRSNGNMGLVYIKG